MQPSLSCAVLVLACLVTPSIAVAQEQPQLSVGASIGAVKRTDILYNPNAGVALDALATLRLTSVLGGNLVTALSGGVDAFFDMGDKCRIDPPVTDVLVCRPELSYRRAALLVGWQRGDTWMFRALAGPAYYGEFAINSDGRAAKSSASAGGAEGRVDLGAPLFGHVGFSLSARGATLPNIRGRSVNIVAGTLGLRLH